MIEARKEVSRKPLAFVLDDESAVAAMICKQLGLIGMEAWQFSVPAKFLAALRVSRPKLVVLDLALGQSDAVEVIQELDILKFTGNVLLISGRDERTLGEIEKIGRSHGLHMLKSLQKPFRASDLKNRLAQHVEPVIAANSKTISYSNARPKIDLAEALREGWLEVWYQPKIDLKTLTVSGAEALIRAEHPIHGIVSPIDLLPLAGDPLYQPLSLFVLQRTMEDWVLFAKRGVSLRLAINVPASVLSGPGFVEAVRRAVPVDRTFPGLIIEITEDEIIRDSARISEVMTQLKLYNATISIDDFGTAHSSLSRVKDLPFSEIKLDRSFVSGCASDPIKRGLCQTVVDLAHRFDASACAEGVELVDDLRCLIELGFDTAQGFLFGKPMRRSHFIVSLLSSQKFEPLPSGAVQKRAKNMFHRA
jgi:EAL domain-containing protein (putative c-di-GMP-specific phosphodiesterase class I)/FixJ family two-component response regulator